jgi:membrane-associated phospholipid phosphatase
MLLVVRNPFGWAFVGVLAAVLLLLGLRASAWASQLALLFLSVQLALSVFSRGDYLFTPTAGSMPSDVANMASALFLPYWFWGALCGAFSVLVLAFGALMFLRSVPAPPGRRGFAVK